MVRTAHGVVCNSAARVRHRENDTGGNQRAEQRTRAKSSSQRLEHLSIRYSWLFERKIWCWLLDRRIWCLHMFSGLHEPFCLPRAQSVRALIIRGCQSRWHGIAAIQGEGTAVAGRARACTRRPERARSLCVRRGLGRASTCPATLVRLWARRPRGRHPRPCPRPRGRPHPHPRRRPRQPDRPGVLASRTLVCAWCASANRIGNSQVFTTRGLSSVCRCSTFNA